MRVNASNWFRLVLWYLGIKKPFELGMGSSTYRIENDDAFKDTVRSIIGQYTFEFLKSWFDHFEDYDDFFEFGFASKLVRLYYWSEQRRLILLAIYDQFVAEQYVMLQVKDKTVLDVGASVGDTAIYFSLMGAAKVIALEPYPATFGLAVKSVSDSQLGNILLLNEGLGEHDFVLSPHYHASPSSEVLGEDDGVRVKFSTLASLVERFDLRDAVLKVDCEGGESLLLSTPESILQSFEQIVLEYHYADSPKPYLSKLSQAGFITHHYTKSTDYIRKRGVLPHRVNLVFGVRARRA